MPPYIVLIEDPTEPPDGPLRQDEPTPEVERGHWEVDAPNREAAIAEAQELHRASYGRVPEGARITVKTADP